LFRLSRAGQPETGLPDVLRANCPNCPRAPTVCENKGIGFHICQKDGLSAVFWQEGAIVCVLISDVEPEAVVQLAFAKAMPNYPVEWRSPRLWPWVLRSSRASFYESEA
jgi:hypothetical protein